MTQYMTYDDYHVGDRFVTPGRTIGETEVSMFAMLTGDFNRLHTDAEYMKGSIFGERIAHGLLGMAIVNGLKYRTAINPDSIVAFLGVNWSFVAPILFNDTIHAVLTVESMRETRHADRGIVVFAIEVHNQRDEVLQRGTMTMMMKRAV